MEPRALGSVTLEDGNRGIFTGTVSPDGHWRRPSVGLLVFVEKADFVGMAQKADESFLSRWSRTALRTSLLGSSIGRDAHEVRGLRAHVL